jgi:hypothetical protein
VVHISRQQARRRILQSKQADKEALLSREGGTHFKVAGCYWKGHKSVGQGHISKLCLHMVQGILYSQLELS